MDIGFGGMVHALAFYCTFSVGSEAFQPCAYAASQISGRNLPSNDTRSLNNNNSTQNMFSIVEVAVAQQHECLKISSGYRGGQFELKPIHFTWKQMSKQCGTYERLRCLVAPSAKKAKLALSDRGRAGMSNDSMQRVSSAGSHFNPQVAQIDYPALLSNDNPGRSRTHLPRSQHRCVGRQSAQNSCKKSPLVAQRISSFHQRMQPTRHSPGLLIPFLAGFAIFTGLTVLLIARNRSDRVKALVLIFATVFGLILL